MTPFPVSTGALTWIMNDNRETVVWVWILCPSLIGESNKRRKLAWRKEGRSLGFFLRPVNQKWPDSIENLQIFSSEYFVWLIYEYLYPLRPPKCLFLFLFCFAFELPIAQPCWFALYYWRAEKVWPVTYLILLPHIPSLWRHWHRLLRTKWRHSRSFGATFRRQF